VTEAAKQDINVFKQMDEHPVALHEVPEVQACQQTESSF
jgi:hypothetical protein